MAEERRNGLSDADIEKIADAVANRTRQAFFIDEEKHYNSHTRLDKVLDAYDAAANIFWKSFLALVIVGAIILAGMTAAKGVK